MQYALYAVSRMLPHRYEDKFGLMALASVSVLCRPILGQNSTFAYVATWRLRCGEPSYREAPSFCVSGRIWPRLWRGICVVPVHRTEWR